MRENYIYIVRNTAYVFLFCHTITWFCSRSCARREGQAGEAGAEGDGSCEVHGIPSLLAVVLCYSVLDLVVFSGKSLLKAERQIG